MARANPFKSFSLKTRAKDTPAEGTAPIGLKEVPNGSEGVGIVKAISHGSEYGRLDSARAKLAEVTVQYGADPKPSKPGKSVPYDHDDQPVRSTFKVPTEHAQALAIGDRVRVSIEKVGA